MDIVFDPLKEDDYPAVKRIYDYYILNTTATFHTGEIELEQLKSFLYVGHPVYLSFMIRQEGITMGYCFLTRFRPRAAYDRTAEITLYISHEYHGKGIGKKAVTFLEAKARERGLKNLIGSITGENISSISLFEKSGYTKCAHYAGVGEKFGRVLDVLEYQKRLDM